MIDSKHKRAKETIDDAEEVRDPLEGLIENTKVDPGAPFTPEVLEGLAALKRDDRAAFETLRAQLKDVGCRVTALDEALVETSGGTGIGRGPTQADILINLAQATELFHTADGTGYVDLDVNSHRETWPIRSKGFKLWLARRFFAETNGAPNSDALLSALNVIEAKARFDAPERSVYIRVGGLDGRIYLDLCNETWQAVEIDSEGWRVIDAPPIRFRRAAGMLPLPTPVGGGSIKELRPFLNVQSDDEFVLVVAWILAALRDCGPYPVLVLLGDHGAAKTTSAKILRTSVDPNTLALRTLPRDERDLHIAATNAWIVGYDNLSFLLDWISDTLCRLSTGGGFGTRQLYTDQDEVLFDAIRPSLLNGIEEVVTRPDLADRAIFLTFVPIPDDKRQTEKELWPKFLAAQPRILGALFDAMATGLKRLASIRLQTLPRMADFAIWITACEGALWQEGTFMRAYIRNIDEAVDTVISASLVADTVRAFMAKLTTPTWSGTATDLLDLLGKVAGEKATRSKTWPTDATRLSGRLRRMATFLRRVGIEISIDRIGRERTRNITIAYKEGTCANPASDKDEDVPTLSDARIHELANDCLAAAAAQLETTGVVDRATLERQLREKLVAEGVPSAAVETEFGRVIEVVSMLCAE